MQSDCNEHGCNQNERGCNQTNELAWQLEVRKTNVDAITVNIVKDKAIRIVSVRGCMQSEKRDVDAISA